MRIKKFFNCLLSLFLILILLGCASTKPNIPYAGPYPLCFNVISTKNPILAKELGKLPEIQDGISANDAVVLEKIAKLYNTDPNSFEKVFEQIYQIGLSEVRKYCSPLQAFFWMIEDGELEAAKDILKDYSLKKLLSSAWDFQLKPFPFSNEQISVIIENTKDIGVQKLYFQNKNDKEYLQYLITRNYKDRPEIFKRQAQKIIRKVESKNEDIKWNDFNTVVERLNAPELVDYYERMKFFYVDWRKLPTHPVSPYYVFKNNKGECISITRFAIYCLRKAGYNAWEYRTKKIIIGPGGSHAFCIFENNGKKYVMDNGMPNPDGIILFDESRYFVK